MKTFKPLVVGPPRSGFTLLSSIINELLPYVNHKISNKDSGTTYLVKLFSYLISEHIVDIFKSYGFDRDVIYNNNFRFIAGGPIWKDPDNSNFVCFRKYIGLKGHGDFTLNFKHPKFILNYYNVTHSHYGSNLWLNDPAYKNYVKFASVRNPVDIINSSCFSLNALASEYIQKFIPPEDDNDKLRQDLALYKLTDLNFFEGLVKFLSDYLVEYIPTLKNYHVMKWEDYISNPISTISQISKLMNVDISVKEIDNIFKKIDHVNLTQAHKHNYRVGHGVLNGWRKELTNEHLEIMKSFKFNEFSNQMGYGDIEYIEPSQYTDFQKIVQSHLLSKKIYNKYYDQELFNFAFNKSNIDSSKFDFRRYSWRNNTQVERSNFKNINLQNEIWDCAERYTDIVNKFLKDYDSSVDMNDSIFHISNTIFKLLNKFSKDLGIEKKSRLKIYMGINNKGVRDILKTYIKKTKNYLI